VLWESPTCSYCDDVEAFEVADRTTYRLEKFDSQNVLIMTTCSQ
jgi:hypothetical protein